MKIDIDKLRDVTTIVTHDDCPDGVASAMILRQAFPTARIVFARHGALDEIEPTPGILFCDFFPRSARAAEFLGAGAIVLDHHRSAKRVLSDFVSSGLGVYADEDEEPGVSGALLAFRHVWAPLRTESDVDDREHIVRLAELAGVRDTWQKNDPRWEQACAQAAALAFYPKDTLIKAAPAEWPGLLAIGPVLMEKKAEEVERSIQVAQRLTVNGVRVAIIPHTMTSDVMEALIAEVDMVVGFTYRCEDQRLRMGVSCRSRGIDVAAIAKAFGGGGHTKAAGFFVDVAKGAPNPYDYLRDLLESAIASVG